MASLTRPPPAPGSWRCGPATGSEFARAFRLIFHQTSYAAAPCATPLTPDRAWAGWQTVDARCRDGILMGPASSTRPVRQRQRKGNWPPAASNHHALAIGMLRVTATRTEAVARTETIDGNPAASSTLNRSSPEGQGGIRKMGSKKNIRCKTNPSDSGGSS
jgi:hypothetical protein